MCLKDTLLHNFNVERGMLNFELGDVTRSLVRLFFYRDAILSRVRLSDKTNVPGYQALRPRSLSGFISMYCQSFSVIQALF